MKTAKTIMVVWTVLGMLGLMATPLLAARGKPDWREATLQIEGLHCAACVDVVGKTLKKTPGVKNAQVFMEDKIAVLEYDQSKTSIQRLARTVDETPSPMRDGEFKSALILHLQELKADEGTETVKSALGKVRGVSKVEVDEEEAKAYVTFDKVGSTQLPELLGAVGSAGLTATAWTPKTRASSGSEHRHEEPEDDSGTRSGGSHCGHSGGGGC